MELTTENIENELMRYARTIQFENGYGLSIVSNPFTLGGEQGLFEAALLCDQGVIMYDKELGFNGVVGHLDFFEVALIIKAVSALPPRDKTIFPRREVY
jgi:hypothetical protein